MGKAGREDGVRTWQLWKGVASLHLLVSLRFFFWPGTASFLPCLCGWSLRGPGSALWTMGIEGGCLWVSSELCWLGGFAQVQVTGWLRTGLWRRARGQGSQRRRNEPGPLRLLSLHASLILPLLYLLAQRAVLLSPNPAGLHLIPNPLTRSDHVESSTCDKRGANSDGRGDHNTLIVIVMRLPVHTCRPPIEA